MQIQHEFRLRCPIRRRCVQYSPVCVSSGRHYHFLMLPITLLICHLLKFQYILRCKSIYLDSNYASILLKQRPFYRSPYSADNRRSLPPLSHSQPHTPRSFPHDCTCNADEQSLVRDEYDDTIYECA